MRQLSDETRTLIAQLGQTMRASWLRRLIRSDLSRQIALLEKIAAAREIAALPYLRDHLLSNNLRVRQAAGAAVHVLITRLRPRNHAWLDEQLRESWLMSIDWSCQLTPDRLTSIVASTSFKSALLGLASCHRSGYVRERAVKLLDELVTDGNELPFLLVRCNDWVAPVRMAAITAVMERLNSAYAAHFLRNIRLVGRLKLCGRSSGENLAAPIEMFLTEPTCCEALLAALDSRDPDIRLACFELLIEGRHKPVSHLIERVTGSRDNKLRFRAVSAAVNMLRGEELKKVLLVFVNDTVMQVRRAALTCLAERFQDLARPYLEKALLDRHSSLRETARFLIGRLQPGHNFRNVYVKLIDSARGWMLTVAIAGIGECGEIADADVLARYLNDALPRNRRAALQASDRLNPAGVVPRLLEAIIDDSPSVSRTAATILRRHSLGMHGEPLIALAQIEQKTHAMCNLLSLVSQVNSWRAVNSVLGACSHKDPKIAEHAKRCLCGLVCRPFTPTGCESDVLQASVLLAKFRPMLSKSVLDTLDFMLRRG